MVRVGTELAKTLKARGIGVLHITDIFDDPAYNGSYGRSLSAAQKALKKYPDIKVTIDLHRDTNPDQRRKAIPLGDCHRRTGDGTAHAGSRHRCQRTRAPKLARQHELCNQSASRCKWCISLLYA